MKINTGRLETDTFQNMNAGKYKAVSDTFTAKKLAFETKSSAAQQSSGYFGKKNLLNN